MLSPGTRPLARLALAAVALLAGSTAPSADAAPGWAGGNVGYQNGLQCFGGNTTGSGRNTGSWVSWYTDPQAGYPAVGDKYWLRLDSMGIGMSCPWGASDVETILSLPERTSLAINLQSHDPNDRVRCFYVGPSNKQTEVTNAGWTHPDNPSIKGKWCDSTKVPSQAAGGYHLGYRLLGPGEQFFVIVPVTSTKRLAGMGGAGDSTKAVATINSGINSTANPFQWITVFDRASQVTYLQDAVSEVTTSSAKTTSILSAWWRKGTAYVDLGFAGADFGVTTDPIAIDGAWPHYTVAQTWTGLRSGTDYQWRLRFVDEQGATTVGETKTFRTGGQPPVTPPPANPGTPGGGNGGTPGGGGGNGGNGGGGGVTPDPGTPSTPGDPAGPGQPGTPNGPGMPSGPTGPDAPGTPGGPAPAPAPGGATVTPGGGSQARSSGGGTDPVTRPATLPPAARLAAGAKLGALLKPAGLAIDVTCPAACDAKVTLRVDAATAKRLGLGRKAQTIASGSGRAAKPGQLRVTLKAAAKAKAKLRRARTVKAQLTVAVPGLAPVTTTVTLAR